MVLNKEISFHLFLLGVFSCCLFILCRLFDFNGLYGQDSYEYARFTNEIHSFFRTGIHPGEFYWPVMFPLLGAFFQFLTGNAAIALQLVSILCFGGSVFFAGRILNFFYSEKPKLIRLFSFVFFGLSPFFIRSSVQAMADSTGIFFLILGTYLALSYSQNRSFINFGAAVFFLALSSMTRYGNAVAALVPTCIAFLSAIQNKKVTHVFFVFFFAFLAVLPHLFFHHGKTMEFLAHPWLTFWSPMNFLAHQFFTPDGAQQYFFPNLIYAAQPFFNPGFIFAGIIFIPFLFVKNQSTTFFAKAFSLSSLLVYGFFVAGIPFQNMRFLLPMFSAILVLYFPVFAHLYEKISDSEKYKKIFLGLAVIIQVSFCFYGLRKSYHFNQIEREISMEIGNSGNHSVYTVGFEGPLNFYTPKKIVYSIWKKGFPFPHSGDLLLLNEEQWSKQWADLEVSENILFLRQNCKWDKLKNFSNGWILYRLNPQNSKKTILPANFCLLNSDEFYRGSIF